MYQSLCEKSYLTGRGNNMNATIQQATTLMEGLPEDMQIRALEFIENLVREWDPDFTKVTPAERRELEEIERDMKENGTISAERIKWGK
jgi:hypothetical protein